ALSRPPPEQDERAFVQENGEPRGAAGPDERKGREEGERREDLEGGAPEARGNLRRPGRAGHETYHRKSPWRSGGNAGAPAAATGVFGRHLRHGARLRRGIHDDLPGEPSPPVFAEETQREAREKTGIGVAEHSAAREDPLQQDLAALAGL